MRQYPPIRIDGAPLRIKQTPMEVPLTSQSITDCQIPSSAASLELALKLSPAPVVFARVSDLQIEWANQGAIDFLKIPATSLAEFALADFIPERELPSFYQVLAEVQRGERPFGTTTLSSDDGIGLCAAAVTRSGDHVLIVAQNDVTNSRQSDQVNHTDALTGLPDRRVLNARLEEAIARKTRDWGVLFIDLNKYKQINDSYGHVAGDRVLVEFAQKLQASRRPNDLVVRYGGDEFVVVVDPVPSEAELKAMASRIAREVNVMVQDKDRTIVISGSVGCAMPSESLSTPEQILEAADRDMYRKKSGDQSA